MSFEITLDVECEGHVTAGSPARFDRWDEQWYPGDAPDVTGFKVFVWNGKARVEITHILRDFEIDELKQKYIDETLEDQRVG